MGLKSFKTIVVYILIFTLLAGMTACSDKTAPSGKQSDVSQSPEKEAAPEVATVVESLPAADTNAGADALIGSWKDISDAESFAAITKTDTGYQYEDKDGKYPATFENGVLKVKASETDTADVYIDPKTGHMVTAYQGGLSEFEKK